MPDFTNYRVPNSRVPKRPLTPKPKSSGERALESAVLTVVEGANQATKSMAQPISRAMDYKRKDAEKAKEGGGTKQPSGWSEAWKRTKEVLTGDQEQVKKDALANAHQHSKQTLGATDKIKSAADRAIKVSDDNSKRIRPKMNGAEKTAAKVIGYGPDLLLSGPSKARIVANRVSSAAQHYGEHRSVAGAVSELLIPGNSKVGNIASNLVAEKLSGK